jgi:pullulanase
LFRIIIHYRRKKQDYQGWGLHVWGATLERTTWKKPLKPFGEDDYGLYWVIRMEKGAEILHYVIHRGEEKDYWSDQILQIEEKQREIWLIESDDGLQPKKYLNEDEAIEALNARGVGDFRNKAQAYWLTRDTIAWHIGFSPHHFHRLYYSADGGMEATPNGIENAQYIPLIFTDKTLKAPLAEKYPHLIHASLLKIPSEHVGKVQEILKGQHAIVMGAAEDKIRAVAGLQIAGVLDDLYAYRGELGVHIVDGCPVLRLWAPTAKSVWLHLYRKDRKDQSIKIEIDPSFLPMKCDKHTGVWEIRGEREWIGLYYLYEIKVFVRQEGKVVRNLVTDPYSISLALNSTHSQIIDIHDPALYPPGWEDITAHYRSPDYVRKDAVDWVIYELHVRDFSANDALVVEEKRGSYLAFTQYDSYGIRHLGRLARAGVTHIHLLPVFDFASVNEDKITWIKTDFDLLASYPSNSYKQQAVLARARAKDGYNWGYDPYHFMTPEGSYAMDGEGAKRILEFRQMVLALFKMGLRVIMDVVFNHTFTVGQTEKSVLDRIVPGYYYRLDSDGNVMNSTCCANTASEHFMMEKLMIDSLLLWAKEYHVHGFRFDLMGHHMKSNLLAVRNALNTLTVETEGVDGSSIYLYGEGWDFGEVAGNARGINATQYNMSGTGIGTFNDRIREALRGGGPFEAKQEQGFATGLFCDPNEKETRPVLEQKLLLLALCDRIRVGLAGNLALYEFIDQRGLHVTGAQIGPGCGYTQNPRENVAYVSAHDNETLFDVIQYKAPLTLPMIERVRMQNLAISVIAFCQGVPFFHAGCELLRSKSMDRDSYDSGDWFNKLDFTYQTNNWGIGLPPQNKNEVNWPIIQELLGRKELAPAPEHIAACLTHFEEVLQIRFSSPLFRLRRAEDVIEGVKFFNTGPHQIPGLIVMQLMDTGEDFIDKKYDTILIFFNADKKIVTFPWPDQNLKEYALHPVQKKSNDAVVRTSMYNNRNHEFIIPGRTTAVFVHEREKFG